ncbi:MAG: M48 family metallopeptidase [Cytophagaceae bacterium]
MNSQQILYIIIGIISFDFLLERILDKLNIQHLSSPLPSNVSDIYDVNEYQKSQSYIKANDSFGQYQNVFNYILQVAVLALGWLGGLYDYCLEIWNHPIGATLLFFGLIFIVSDILSTPFSYYKTFVIEEKYGFNKTTKKLFWMDKIKGYLLGIIIGGIILYILLYLINTIGSDFWWIFWAIISVIIIFVNMFYTSLLLPLFNKLTPLEDGELKSAIQAYCKAQDFPVNNIYVMDGSKRSNKANAFFSGFGSNKKIVLFDTLVQQHTIEEIVAVLAHEAGHFKKKHIPQMMVLSVLQMGFYLYLLSQFVFSTTITEAMGSQAELSIALNLIGFGLLISPISTITGVLINMFSRKNEYEADNFAVTTYPGDHLVNALKKLSQKNLSNLTPHPAYVFVHYSHPPVTNRIKAMKGE